MDQQRYLYFALLYQPIPTIIRPAIITAVLLRETGENKQDIIRPVPAPVNHSIIDCLYLPGSAAQDNSFHSPDSKQSAW